MIHDEKLNIQLSGLNTCHDLDTCTCISDYDGHMMGFGELH